MSHKKNCPTSTCRLSFLTDLPKKKKHTVFHASEFFTKVAPNNSYKEQKSQVKFLEVSSLQKRTPFRWAPGCWWKCVFVPHSGKFYQLKMVIFSPLLL